MHYKNNLVALFGFLIIPFHANKSAATLWLQ